MVGVESLKDVAIFAKLSEYELENVARLADERTYESDKRIFAEGALAQRLYILVDGEVEIRIQPNHEAEPVTVDTITAGEIFGWSALTQPYSLTAAAWVTKKARVIAISGDSLRDLFGKNNHTGYLVMTGISTVISSRLRHVRERMVELLSSRVSKG